MDGISGREGGGGFVLRSTTLCTNSPSDPTSDPPPTHPPLVVPLNAPHPTVPHTLAIELETDASNPIVGIFGPGCSSVAVHVASTAPLFNYVVFSAVAG